MINLAYVPNKKNCLFFQLNFQKKCGNTSELLNEHKKCTMIIYDNFTSLSSHKTLTSLRAKYITATFNVNIRMVIHTITI